MPQSRRITLVDLLLVVLQTHSLQAYEDLENERDFNYNEDNNDAVT